MKNKVTHYIKTGRSIILHLHTKT